MIAGCGVPFNPRAFGVFLPVIDGSIWIPFASHLRHAAKFLAAVDGEQEDHLFARIATRLVDDRNPLSDLLHDRVLRRGNRSKDVVWEISLDVYDASL